MPRLRDSSGVDLNRLDESPWQRLPDSILLEIFAHLRAPELICASETCKSWRQVAGDNLLWKSVFSQRWRLSASAQSLGRVDVDWRFEYERLHQRIPCVECEVHREHTDEVLHVSFSPDGNLFATSSKDTTVKIWASGDGPSTLLFNKDMREFQWKYTQSSQFNPSVTLLLVAGVLDETQRAESGEIAVFDLCDPYQLLVRIVNKPFDVFSSWFDDNCLISGTTNWIASLTSNSTLCLNEVRNIRSTRSNSTSDAPISHDLTLNNVRLFDFINKNGSSIRDVIVADCKKQLRSMDSPMDRASLSWNRPREPEDKQLIFTSGSWTYVPHQIVVKHVSASRVETCRRSPPTIYEPFVRSDADGVPEALYEMHGHVIGMALSPDHRFLYVNCRAWPANYRVGEWHNPPPIAEEIRIHVFDLLTMENHGTLHASHSAFTPNDDCFFIFLSVSAELVASGAEDNKGYVWDRRYPEMKGHLATLAHDDVVNSVAFNPVDPEMLVSVSDDFSVKIWRSRRRAKETSQITKMLP